MTYPAEIDTPGSRAARQFPGTGDKAGRMQYARDVMAGSRTVEEPSPYVPTANRDNIDRDTLRAAAIERMQSAEVEAARHALEEEQAPLEDEELVIDESAFDENWLAEARDRGYIDDNGNVSDNADEMWMEYGEQAGYFDATEGE